MTGTQTISGATTVQLHGLPIGTTLVLINGRRVESAGIAGAQGLEFFDLNNLPLSAVERIEVVPEGSSAVYGSDAIAGVINIVLRRNFNGLEASVKYGGASGTHETDASLAWGQHWDRGSVSLIGSFQDRSELTGSARSITANQNYTRFGGLDQRFDACPLADIYSTTGGNLPGTNAPFAAVSATSTPQQYAATPGALNACSISAYGAILPETRRGGVLLQGDYNLTPSVNLFAEAMFSHVEQRYPVALAPLLFGLPGFQQFTVSASNPFNPYGETVGVSGLLNGPVTGAAIPITSNFFRPLVGARGDFFNSWHWEATAWLSRDQTSFTQAGQLNATAVQTALDSSNPATALDPFVAGSWGSSALLRSLVTSYNQKLTGETKAVNGFLRGSLWTLPSGSIDVVIGSEYDRDTFESDNRNYPYGIPGDLIEGRTSYAFFGESRIPIIANHSNPPAGDVLAVSLAGRYDHFSDFGGKTTPQFGAEWRPVDSLLIRGTYGRSFKAPSLVDLHSPTSSGLAFVTDPLLGNQTFAVNGVGGGNPNLRPENGQSRTFGVVYSSKALPDLQLSIANWHIDESNNIQSFTFQQIVDNSSLFPGSVMRAAQCANGPPCPIVQVNGTFVNFGQINVAGFDYQANYKYQAPFGELSGALSAAQTYHYSEALVPSAPTLNAAGQGQDSGDWAPKWKGVAALGWKLGPYSASFDGRYTGHYQDYNSTRVIGGFWLYDANFRYAVGNALAQNNRLFRGLYLEAGGVNLFNTLPQYSNYGGGFVGYDPTQGDIRGRFLFVKIGGSL